MPANLIATLVRRWAARVQPASFSKNESNINRVLRDRWREKRDKIQIFMSLYDLALDHLLLAGNATWIENAFLPEHYPTLDEACVALRLLVTRHVLMESGNASVTAQIFESLHGTLDIKERGEDRFFRQLSRYVADEIDALAKGSQSSQPAPKIVLGLAVWGEKFIRRAVEQCFASLAAPGNVAELKRRQPTAIVIHTAARDQKTIEGLGIDRKVGTNIVVRPMPDALVDSAQGDAKYWLLGGAQSLHLGFAIKISGCFGMLFPDVVYSNNYLANILRPLDRGASATLLSAFGSNKSTLEDLKSLHGNGIYDIPSTALVDSACRHIHPYFVSMFMTGVDEIPRSAGIFINQGNVIKFHSAHYNIAMLNTLVCRNLRPRYFLAIDSQIEKVLPDATSVYMREGEDAYFATGIDSEPRTSCDRLDMINYAEYYAQRINAFGMELFLRPYCLRISEPILNVPVLEDGQAREIIFMIAREVAARWKKQDCNFDRLPWVLEVLDRYGGGGDQQRAYLASHTIANLKIRFESEKHQIAQAGA